MLDIYVMSNKLWEKFLLKHGLSSNSLNFFTSIFELLFYNRSSMSMLILTIYSENEISLIYV